ncbi:hypothetical protein BJY24_002112 [Nocardia transvalensis]|uniref:Uncharacterized protein n=1 Tax=Nocardia transvalensis TaxID=37333 RepID=A0A7W9UI14_9NOCA|nr:hypothetical protein [Nocardia transvalensis]MBB5913245.1 hypothetical protein [Nocardia transvalensis]
MMTRSFIRPRDNIAGAVAALYHNRPHGTAPVDYRPGSDRGRGIDYLTFRRVAELAQAVDFTTGSALRGLLARHRSDRYKPPLYRTI